jgi:hypothetical protein
MDLKNYFSRVLKPLGQKYKPTSELARLNRIGQRPMKVDSVMPCHCTLIDGFISPNGHTQGMKEKD